MRNFKSVSRFRPFRSKGPPAGKMYGSIRRKVHSVVNTQYVSRLSMIPGLNLSQYSQYTINTITFFEGEDVITFYREVYQLKAW